MDRVLNRKFWLKSTKCVNVMAPTFATNLIDVKGYQLYKNGLRSNNEGKLYQQIQ